MSSDISIKMSNKGSASQCSLLISSPIKFNTSFILSDSLIVFIISGIAGGLLSSALNLMQGNNILAVGASGAIFGLMGALLYFGYHYRTYLGEALKKQIIPVIILNLALGFILTGIDNYAHIGGLVAGIFATMAVGVESKSKGAERVSGLICLVTYLGVVTYLLLK